MDFLSRIFTFSNNKKSDLKSDQGNITPSHPKGVSHYSEKYHESGAYCRESRVDIDETESPYPTILTESSDNEEHGKEVMKTSSPLITRTLDRWNPETCVRLLRMPSVQNYSGLRKLISESDKNWMIEFLDMGGLEVLFESVDRLSSKSYSARLERTLLLLQCVQCLKAVVNSHTALEHIIQSRTYAKKIAKVLCSQNPLVKKQLFDFMSTLCVYSEEGHYLTLDVFESYRVIVKFRYRFAVLIIEIKQAEVMPYVGAVLGVINCIILGACGFRFRTRIRNEFLALGLQDLLESLKQIPEEEVQLQCSVFVKSQLADEEYARSMGIRSSFSHFALFQAVLDKIEDTPLSASFLVVLQNLNQLDPADSKTDYVWSILEEITERAVTGAGSLLRNWMLSECRRSSLKSAATQTCLLIPQALTIEDSMTYLKASLCDDDCEKESVKSYTSFDSGIPVSRNQSFASSGPRSAQSTLLDQKLNAPFEDPIKLNSDLTTTIKDLGDDDFSNTVQEDVEKRDHENTKQSGGFFTTVGLSFIVMKSSSNKTHLDSVKRKSNDALSETPLSLRSESPIPQSDIMLEESSKTKKTFSFPFFSRSKKYSLTKNPPKVTVNPPSPDVKRSSKDSISSATLRNGMTSMDVKRSRKQTQLPNVTAHDKDSFSLTSEDQDNATFSDTSSSTFEFYENYPGTPFSQASRSFPTTPERETLNVKDPYGSKTTSDLCQSIPPPPPPPPPPMFNSPEVAFRPKSQLALGLPAGKNLRSSWSGNPTAKEFEEAEKRFYNTLPRPKSKMKTLNWAKIPSSHVSVHSIWSEIDKETKPMELNFEEMEKLFCQNEPVRQEIKTRRKQRENSEISLLDSKRSLSIGVFLKQFKGGLEEVIEYIKQCKHKEIGAEKLRTLLNLLPNPNEIQQMNSYSGDVNKLGAAEKFILRVSAIDRYECRVEGMLLLDEFPSTIQVLHDSVQSLLDACQELLINKGFKNFLKLVLVTGNFMNSGSYAGNAVGFRLSTLPKLMETRANRPRITLLHYLVEETQRKDPEGIKFTYDLLDKLNRCSRLTLESLDSEITQLEKTTLRLKSQIDTENGQLRKYFSGFAENGMKHLVILKNKMSDIKKISAQLATRFCEDEKKFQLEECLNLVSVFCNKIRIADSENRARQTAEEKKQTASGNKIESKFRSSKTSTL